VRDKVRDKVRDNDLLHVILPPERRCRRRFADCYSLFHLMSKVMFDAADVDGF